MAEKPKHTSSRGVPRKSGMALVPFVVTANEIAEVGGDGLRSYREGGTSGVADRPYVMCGRTVTGRIDFMKEAEPCQGGPRLGEAEGRAWRAAPARYACIKLHRTSAAHLGGHRLSQPDSIRHNLLRTPTQIAGRLSPFDIRSREMGVLHSIRRPVEMGFAS